MYPSWKYKQQTHLIILLLNLVQFNWLIQWSVNSKPNLD